jgi:hypothetical protein
MEMCLPLTPDNQIDVDKISTHVVDDNNNARCRSETFHVYVEIYMRQKEMYESALGRIHSMQRLRQLGVEQE